MITDTKEIAKRLRIEAGCWRDYHKDAMDMPVYELFDKLADLIEQ